MGSFCNGEMRTAETRRSEEKGGNRGRREGREGRHEEGGEIGGMPERSAEVGRFGQLWDVGRGWIRSGGGVVAAVGRVQHGSPFPG